ncbi:hypothetical protein T11_4414 [Trichinella zimbabwensis]|uniref:Uncharacterized protein n=1 Tax=Trichinella zimbabwensis TaxID=268475 RepID=A0A0V1I5M1_9BILA|nr:hypothetical protein T11_4414 [Trichinella zimbabwensis]
MTLYYDTLLKQLCNPAENMALFIKFQELFIFCNYEKQALKTLFVRRVYFKYDTLKCHRK